MKCPLFKKISLLFDKLNDLGIDRISMAGIMGTLEQENLNENTF